MHSKATAQAQREAESGLELALMRPRSGRLPSHLGLLYSSVHVVLRVLCEYHFKVNLISDSHWPREWLIIFNLFINIHQYTLNLITSKLFPDLLVIALHWEYVRNN